MDLHQRYTEVRERTEGFCAPLKNEDYVPQAVEFISPPKWHLAHTSWFFEEMVLKKYLKGYREFDPAFGFLFNSYYNTLGQRTIRKERGFITRPGVEEVYQYRAHVDRNMKELLDGQMNETLHDLVLLGLNHEQQHQELLISDLKYSLSLNPTHPVYRVQGSLLEDKNEEEGWIDIPAGVYEIGFQEGDFCYDNELDRHKVYLEGYSIARHLVTNGEFLEFLEEGGYRDFRYWHDDAWAWLNEHEIEHPLYWKKIDGRWYQFTLGGLQELDPGALLSHISYYEAFAYAHWKGYRLPTEFEWEAASDQFDWGLRWEWTNSAYLPYPGFKIAEGAVGEYNAKFMVNQMVLRGASVATAPGHSRKTYRNFFHPHLQWQFAGIRLAK